MLNGSDYVCYVHTFPDGRPFYVGAGRRGRAKDFRKATRKRNRQHAKIVAKYGKENIGVFCYQCESAEEAFQLEKEMIKLYKVLKEPLVNVVVGRGGVKGINKGREITQEQRDKISRALKGRKLPPETCMRMSIARKGGVSPTKGMKFGPPSEETRRKISEANKGRIITAEHREKVSKANKGRVSPRKGVVLSEEIRQKISIANRGRRHGPMSEDTKRKLSLRKKGVPKSAEHRAKLSAANKGKCWTCEQRLKFFTTVQARQCGLFKENP